MRRKKIVFVIAGIIILLFVVWGVGSVTANRRIRFANQLGSGINLGNSLEATGLRQYKSDAADLEYEVFWGNPEISREQFSAIRQAGFSSVRIPVTWQDHMDEEGTVSEIWMNRVTEVVDMALEENLYVILDTHHEEWLNLETEREQEICDTYRSLWTQIAQQFQEYDEHLLFEGMNEPRLRKSEHEWDAGTPEMRAMVNRLNEAFIESVRETGGENRERYLLISAYASGTEEEALEDLVVPEGNIIVAVHMYLPYSFCQDEDGITQWDDPSGETRAQVEKVFANLERLFIKKHIPVIITEFGCKDKGNEEERAAWINFYRKLADAGGIPCFWWDNGSNYQILNRNNGKWVYPKLVEALVK